MIPKQPTYQASIGEAQRNALIQTVTSSAAAKRKKIADAGAEYQKQDDAIRKALSKQIEQRLAPQVKAIAEERAAESSLLAKARDHLVSQGSPDGKPSAWAPLALLQGDNKAIVQALRSRQADPMAPDQRRIMPEASLADDLDYEPGDGVKGAAGAIEGYLRSQSRDLKDVLKASEKQDRIPKDDAEIMARAQITKLSGLQGMRESEQYRSAVAQANAALKGDPDMTAADIYELLAIPVDPKKPPASDALRRLIEAEILAAQGRRSGVKLPTLTTDV